MAMFALDHIRVLIVTRVHFDNANMFEVPVYVLTDLLSFRVLLIRIYIRLCMKRQKQSALCVYIWIFYVCISFLLLFYVLNRRTKAVLANVCQKERMKEMYLTL